MEGAEVHRLVGEVVAVDDDCRDRDVLVAAIGTAARLRAWLDGRDVRMAARLAVVTTRPEQVVAGAARTSVRDADRVVERSRTVSAIPALGEALDNGTVSGGHVDAVGRVLRQLEPCHRDALARSAGWLVGLAATSTPAELHKALTVEMDQLRADEGVSRLERQRRATRLDTWIDDEGMWCLRGRYDPETGLKLHSRLTNTVAALFADKTPDDCPFHPLERQAFLRAHALAALTEGSAGGGGGQPEIVAVLDVSNPDRHGAPTVDWGVPVELPSEVLRRLFDTADVHPIIVRGGVVLHAPGRLNLGRTTRLANRAQRRALRALYKTCAIPGCDTRYDLCKLHHIIWWEHEGRTDLDNLLPLCVRHHHDVHDHGWHLVLAADRSLTITYPDGTSQSTAPPTRRRPHRPPSVAVPATDSHHSCHQQMPLRT